MTDRVTFGKTSWDAPAPSMGGNDDFMQLNKDGQYVVRILGDSPLEYAVHWTEDVNGNKRYEEITPLVDVPFVVITGGVGGLQMPIAAGDECLLFFNDREIDNWYVSGEISTPTSRRTHDFSDAVALVGVRSLSRLLVGYLADQVKLYYNNTSVVLDDTQIELNASDKVVTNAASELNGDTIINGDLRVNGDIKYTGTLADLVP